jgi:hypothetical protein
MVDQDFRWREVLWAHVGGLYANANLGVCVTKIAATILVLLQWGMVSKSVAVGWWFYMTLVSVSRYVFARHFRHAIPGRTNINKWCMA